MGNAAQIIFYLLYIIYLALTSMRPGGILRSIARLSPDGRPAPSLLGVKLLGGPP